MASKTPAVKKVKTQKQKEMSTNNYIAVMVAVGFIIVVASGYFGYLLVKENLRNSIVIGGKIKAQSDISQKLEDADTVISNYNSLTEQERRLIMSALPSTDDFPQIISLVEAAAKDSNVSVKTMTALGSDTAATAAGTPSATTGSVAPAAGGVVADAASTDDGKPKTFLYTAEIEGSYANLARLFRNLELSARPMKVQAFELKGNDSTLTGTLTIGTYYQGKANLKDTEEVVK